MGRGHARCLSHPQHAESTVSNPSAKYRGLMKKRSILTKISIAVLLVGGTITGSAFALAATYTPTKVGCFDNGTCYVVVSPAVPANHSTCGDHSQVRWKLPNVAGGLAGGTEIYRTALTAMMAGRTLDINVSSNACVDGYPQVFYMNAN